MNNGLFSLDPRLAADTLPVAELSLCSVRLMNDSRFPWLVLVPRRPGLVEVADLLPVDHTALWIEVNRAASALRASGACDKINIGALGNIVRQLHVHVVARLEGDPAWPGPVWGSGAAQAWPAAEAAARIEHLRGLLTGDGEPARP